MMPKFLSLSTAALFSALALSAPIASAGLVNNYTFDGDNNNSLGTSVTFAGDVAGGPSVTVNGYLLTGTTWGLEEVSRGGNALGVNSTPGDNGNNATIGPRVEGLLFDMGAVVYGSIRLNFSNFSGVDNADIWAGTSNIIATNFVGATQLANNSTGNPFTSDALNFRYIFVANTDTPNGLCTGGQTQTTSNCFRVDNLQVIPEPGSMALVGAGLLLATAVRRRRSN